jgi:hypothetical protein
MISDMRRFFLKIQVWQPEFRASWEPQLRKVSERLPAKWKGVVKRATEKSLKKALSFAVKTMDDKTRPASSDKTHKVLVFATGAGGGSFGLPALAVELPVTTTIMLRSINRYAFWLNARPFI